MDVTDVLLLVALLFTKHAIVDFPMQTPYQYLNKGTYGHPGGWVHAGLHGLFTLIVFLFFVTPYAAICLALIDAIIHYHVDWAKMNINKKMGWGPNTHEQFWWLLGLDQYFHAMTYVALIWMAL